MKQKKFTLFWLTGQAEDDIISFGKEKAENEVAKRIAMEWYNEEADDFIGNMQDFASAKIIND